MSDFSSNLQVLSFGRRSSDGKVVIRFSITEPGVYYLVRYCCRALAPGDTEGLVMTPALDDPEHSKDPLIVATANQSFTWIWDAPADGVRTGDLNNWSLYLAYFNLYCCSHNLLKSVTEQTLANTPASSSSTNSSSSPAAGPTTQPVPAPAPSPAPAAPSSSTSPPTSVSTKTSKGHGFFSSWVSKKTSTSTPTASASVKATPTSTSPSSVTTGGNTASSPVSTPASNTAAGSFFGSGSSKASSDYFGKNNPVGTVNSDPPTTKAVDFVPGSKAPLSWYALDDDNPLYNVETYIVPGDSVPLNASPLFIVIFTLKAGGCTNWKMYVEGRDSEGNRFCFNSGEPIDDIDPADTTKVRSKAFCLNLKQFKTGTAKICAVILGGNDSPIAGKVRDLEITGEQSLPVVSRSTDLTSKVIEVAGLSNSQSAKFAGSYHSYSAADYYIIKAVQKTGVVVKATAQGLKDGFAPVLKIFDSENLTTPIVATSSRMSGLSESDKACFSVGWIDDSNVLTVGHYYYVQVVHSTAAASNTWGFRVYTNGIVDETTVNSEVDLNGDLDGTITSPYGLQALKIVNERDGASLFVLTNEDGTADIQDDAQPPGDKMAVEPGDYIRVYRPGIGLVYNKTDLLVRQMAGTWTL